MDFAIREELMPIVTRWLEANPISAHHLGIHTYDGQLPNFSKEQIQKRILELKSDISFLKNLDCTTKMEQFEKDILQMRLEEELFNLEEHREFEENPMVYVFPLTVIEMSYTARSFDTIENRLKSIIQIERQIPGYLRTAKDNLKESLASAKINMAIQFLKGIMTFLKDTLISFVVQSDDEQLIDEWSKANIRAVEALADFFDALNQIYLPKSHDNFAMGAEKFVKLLSKTEFVSVGLDKLLEVGEKDLEKNFQKMQEIIDRRGMEFFQKVLNNFPAEDQLIPWVLESLDRTRDYLISRGDIVSLPTTEQCTVVPTPQFARGFAFAAMSTPGPFEPKEASEAYYWITPPDTKWTKEKKEEFLKFFSRAFLEMVTIHEVWPGHYLQLLFSVRTQSDLIKMFARSTTMIEGYAHYAEEMIYESGYEPFDRDELHIGQLLGALIRNCRYVAAIRMHAKGMTIEEAKQLFMEKAFMPEVSAQIEAARGTVNPMYLNYTLGKLLIKKLRQDYKEEKGDQFSLKEFHDRLLSYGSPPIVALRKLMLDSPGTDDDLL